MHTVIPRYLLPCFAIGLVSASCASDSVFKERSEITASLSQLETSMEREVAQHQLDTLAIALMEGDEVFYSKGFGISADSPRQAGSISKPLSAFAALRLVEQGVLALDTPLNEYVAEPYLSSPAYPDTVDLKMVLSHTSGLGNDPTGSDRTLYFAPGSEFRYSGGGFMYLQTAIQDTLEMPFDEFIAAEAFAPLGMQNSEFAFEYQGMRLVLAAASLVSTPAEIAAFFGQLARPSPDNAQLVASMLEPRVSVTDDLSWGLGVGIYAHDDGELVWHWGSNLGMFHTLAVIDRESGIGAVVMATGENALESLRRVVHEAIGGPQYAYWDDVPVD